MLSNLGCSERDEDVRSRTMSTAEFHQRLPDLAQRVKASSSSSSQFRYELVEIQVTRSYVSDLTFLQDQQPLWEGLVVRSDEVGLNTAEFPALLPIANLRALHVPYISDEAFRRLHEMHSLDEFDISQGGSVLNHLRSLNLQREELSLSSLSIPKTYGVKGNAHVFPTHFSRLERLDLSYTDVEDADLVEIAKLSRLRRLNLQGTRVSAAGIQKLMGCSTLEAVNALGTSIVPDEIGETPFNVRLDRNL